MSIIPPPKKSGFTLIEIVIVLAIAALIMVIVFVAVQGALMGRRNDQRRSDARRVLAAVESYPAIYPTAPTDGQDVNILTRRLLGIDTTCGFEDPSITKTIDVPCTNTGSARPVKMRIQGIGTGVAPWIEIKIGYKCDGNKFSTNPSPDSNAVMFSLEPFTVSWPNRYGTNSCINT